MNKFTLSVSSSFGIEGITKRELEKYSVSAPCENGRFTFESDFETLATLSLNLRTADRIFILLGKFTALSFDELFDNILTLNLKDYISKNGKINVKVKSTNSKLYALSASASIAKKAIVQNLMSAYNTTILPENAEEYKIEIAIKNDVAEVLLDTSGIGLHKRGYRNLAYTAPLKETIAAALIDLSVWNDSKTLIDPFCGSGTIPLEAAMIALNIAPGINRSFAFESYPFFDKKIFDDVKTKAKDEELRDKKISILGFDIEDKAISMSLYHAKNLGLANKIHFQKLDMRDVKSAAKYGVIITNPPYGERLSSPKEVRALYADFGKMYKDLDCFSAYVLTAMPDFERITKLKVNKERKIFNGKIECRFYQVLGPKPPKNYGV